MRRPVVVLLRFFARLQNVRAAGKLPQFWAAEMTYLERRHPDRWGRRTGEADAPRVIVQIGARDSDVTINVGVVNQMVDDGLLPAASRIPQDVIERQRADGYQVQE